MNSIKLFYENASTHPEKMAIADIEHGELSFGDLLQLSAQVQSKMKALRVSKHDSVLVALSPSPVLYAVICGLMGMGVRIIFIEPWLSLDRIGHVIQETNPKAFICSLLGKIWGARSSPIRKIPNWITPGEILNTKASAYQLEELDEDHQAFIVFSSGTTGAPKGVVRTHGYMQTIYDVFTELEPQVWDSPDLIIFPNVALFHLATGRGSVIVPHKWSRKNLQRTVELCRRYRPQTLSTGPAFLKVLLDFNLLTRLEHFDRIVIGGALTDCWIMEKVMEALPGRRFLHIYGGSEAEPVALVDARIALERSQRKGYFQVLCLGEIVPQVSHQLREGVLWVSGPNVAGEYVGAKEENAGIKERDAAGKLWHCMGDRMTLSEDFLWYAGRVAQRPEDFELEQKIYSDLQSSKSFIHRHKNGDLYLVGERVNILRLKKKYPQIKHFIESKIIRDKRHRSRIDRRKSLPKHLRSS